MHPSVCVSETWLDWTVANSEIALDGYNILQRDHDRHGGCVCSYIQNNIIGISGGCKLMLYADDNAFLYSLKDPQVISERLGQEL